jgi:hypothetical protein
VPADARALLVATLALARADTGALPAARGLLERDRTVAADRTVRWVAAETSWLAGEAEAARDAADALAGSDMPPGWPCSPPGGHAGTPTRT